MLPAEGFEYIEANYNKWNDKAKKNIRRGTRQQGNIL